MDMQDAWMVCFVIFTIGVTVIQYFIARGKMSVTSLSLLASVVLIVELMCFAFIISVGEPAACIKLH